MAFLRVFRGKSLGRKEVWSVTWAFFGRFFVLGLLILAILLPVEIAIYLTTKDAPRALLLSWPFWLVLDVGLTFVTPALTYSARRARLAVGIGLRMIKETWPACAWYALVPPFAALIFIRIRPPPSAILAVSLTALAALVNLWFKGATGAFYLRRQPEVGDDGAARP